MLPTFSGTPANTVSRSKTMVERMNPKAVMTENAVSNAAGEPSSTRDGSSEAPFSRRWFAVPSRSNRNPAFALALMVAVCLPAMQPEAQIVHRVPYFPSASHAATQQQQGFLRITNWGHQVARLRDPGGGRHGCTRGDVVSLSVSPGKSTHLNSDDLENGGTWARGSLVAPARVMATGGWKSKPT